MVSIYRLKPHFQNLLRPVANWLYAQGVTANQITLLACLISLAVGGTLSMTPEWRIAFAVIPLWMFLRMALNALDGMLAREFSQQSMLGGYLNELGDAISDAALYFPFAFVAPFHPLWIACVIFLATLSEFAGVLGATMGASRRYDGPMGKSDRAFIFGVLGLGVALTSTLPIWLEWLMPLLALTIGLTIVNRIRKGLAELAQNNRPES